MNVMMIISIAQNGEKYMYLNYFIIIIKKHIYITKISIYFICIKIYLCKKCLPLQNNNTSIF